MYGVGERRPWRWQEYGHGKWLLESRNFSSFAEAARIGCVWLDICYRAYPAKTPLKGVLRVVWRDVRWRHVGEIDFVGQIGET